MRFGKIKHSTVKYGNICYGQYGKVWYGYRMVWYGVVWYDMVHGIVLYSIQCMAWATNFEFCQNLTYSPVKS